MKPTITKNTKLNDFLPPHYPIYFHLCRHYSLLTVIAVVQGSYPLLSAINQNVSNNKSACFNFSLYRGNVLQLYYSQLKHVSSFNFQTYCQWWLPHPTPIIHLRKEYKSDLGARGRTTVDLHYHLHTRYPQRKKRGLSSKRQKQITLQQYIYGPIAKYSQMTI